MGLQRVKKPVKQSERVCNEVADLDHGVNKNPGTLAMRLSAALRGNLAQS